jgi:hypothetical protein
VEDGHSFFGGDRSDRLSKGRASRARARARERAARGRQYLCAPVRARAFRVRACSAVCGTDPVSGTSSMVSAVLMNAWIFVPDS